MITIVVNSSNEYAIYCGVMLTSLFEKNKDNDITVYVLTLEMSDDNKEKLYKLSLKYNQTIIIKTITDSEVNNLPVHFGYHNLACYLRVLAADILPDNINKFLYLDCDIIINGDISELWNINISSYALAATKDLPRFEANYKKNLGLDANDIYFNSGVMLINVNYWKENRIANKVLQYAQENENKIIACDQDCMNAVFKGSEKVFIISRKWNVYPDVFFECPELYKEEMKEVSSIRKNPIIIHFLYNKAWYSDCHNPYRCLFYSNFKLFSGNTFKPLKNKHSSLQIIKQYIKYYLHTIGIFKRYNVYDKCYNKGSKRLTWC